MAYRPTARTEIARLKRSLDELFDRAFGVDAGSELAGDINRYLCVRVSGFFEQALLVLGRSACERMSGGIAESFALSWLERSFNPSQKAVLSFVNRFSPSWEAELSALLKDNERGSRLNSLIGIRNDVVHGKNQGVSVVQALGYYDLTVEVLDWLTDRLEPVGGAQPASPP